MKPTLSFKWTPQTIALANAFYQAGTTTLKINEVYDRYTEYLDKLSIYPNFKNLKEKLYRFSKTGLITFNSSKKRNAKINIYASDFFLAQYKKFIKEGVRFNKVCSIVASDQLFLDLVKPDRKTPYFTADVNDLIALTGVSCDGGQTVAHTAVRKTDDDYYTVLTKFELEAMSHILKDFSLICGRYLLKHSAISDCTLKSFGHQTKNYWIILPWGESLRISHKQYYHLRNLVKEQQKKEAA